MKIVQRAKHALWAKSGLRPGEDYDEVGYVHDVTHNLVRGVTAAMIEADYRRGSGQEWLGKFRAIHSSAALAANTFGRWKSTPEKLKFLGFDGFGAPLLEKQCATGLGGIPPNLDVFLQSRDAIIGIESKLLEPLTPKRPNFSDAYAKKSLPFCENQWWTLLQDVKAWPRSHLDAAQLVRHYLGLRNQFRNNGKVILVYLFWKPLNADDVPEYERHAEELEKFTSRISGGLVQFVAKSYLELWDEWASDPALRDHAETLRRRYCVRI